MEWLLVFAFAENISGCMIVHLLKSEHVKTKKTVWHVPVTHGAEPGANQRDTRRDGAGVARYLMTSMGLWGQLCED